MAQGCFGAAANLDWLVDLCAYMDSTKAWHHLRPLLIPLYKALHTIPTTMVGIDQVSFAPLRDMVSDDLMLKSSLTSIHHSLNPGTKILRVANIFVATKTELAAVHLKSRRV